jgi:hypothetical protein
MMREKLVEAMARAMAVKDSAAVGTVLHDEIHWPEFGPGYIECAMTALSAIEAMGYVIVPKNMTDEIRTEIVSGILSGKMAEPIYHGIVKTGKV